MLIKKYKDLLNSIKSEGHTILSAIKLLLGNNTNNTDEESEQNRIENQHVE